MDEILTASQMRAIETAAIVAGQVSGLALMERAGQGVVEEIFRKWPELAPQDSGRGASPSHSPRYLEKDECGRRGEVRRAVVLCGPGNNGGDGFVVARCLKESGWDVDVYLAGVADGLPPDALENYRRWQQIGTVQDLSDYDYGAAGWGCDLLVDALFGTGLSRPVEGLGELFRGLRELVCTTRVGTGPGVALPKGQTVVVAVDMPSGVCADSGRVLAPVAGVEEADSLDEAYRGEEAAAYAHLTVSFHAPKPGHVLADGPLHCGELRCVDIGLPTTSEPGTTSRDALVDLHQDERIGRHVCRFAEGFSPHLAKGKGAHKYAHGHVVVLSGGGGRTGAARLAARAALRVGAGLVTLAVPPDAMAEVAAQVTAVMVAEVGGGAALEEVLSDPRLRTVCLGPGLGLERARELTPIILSDPARAVVLDADALSAYGDDPDRLFGMLHPNCVLTPHAGEFARLFPDLSARLGAQAESGPAYSKVDATRAAARRAGCVVLFKGPDTVVADQSGLCRINAAVYERAAPWLGTAGAGDVLAGIVAGLLARQFAAPDAASHGAWLHVDSALAFGPGLIAEDLPEQLPAVFRRLGL
ncbi:NAD(P)H-hydrate dehydratase [Phaeobacter sp. B1627]|uniref:NAD(P)H-hydrate dehydratase n=1 Tax=Phaeobacter sp. B1627 TaxID=2583809 RepID=UPI00111835BE|nr:NAD(P)H-hydrate dehydratase [Phaeobacter sp. B1627]TNJ40885.1 NAD(P)H-hydrate dehydratase [Phaeobacter sp. B1627]